MSRYKATVRILVLAVTLLAAAGSPARANGVPGQEKAQVGRLEKPNQGFWSWLKIRLTRYAMAAN